jgi:hypothetical protein
VARHDPRVACEDTTGHDDIKAHSAVTTTHRPSIVLEALWSAQATVERRSPVIIGGGRLTRKEPFIFRRYATSPSAALCRHGPRRVQCAATLIARQDSTTTMDAAAPVRAAKYPICAVVRR